VVEEAMAERDMNKAMGVLGALGRVLLSIIISMENMLPLTMQMPIQPWPKQPISSGLERLLMDRCQVGGILAVRPFPGIADNETANQVSVQQT
jgi:hypothetical protein